MKRLLPRFVGMLVVGTLFAGVYEISSVTADEDKREVTISDTKLQLVYPKGWARKQPRSRIVEHEFAAPKAEGDDADARVTIMGAGGGVQANIDRWIDQFKQADGSSSRDKAKIEKGNVAGQEVTTVDISGTYKDQPGPFAPAVQRENYRMLGAIIATKENGQYFVKMYGPKKTMAAHEKAFFGFVESLTVKK